MNLKKLSLIFLFTLSLGFEVKNVDAASVTGEAYAKVFGPMFMDSGPGVNIEDKNSPGCDEGKQTCLIKGVSWSDVIGWTAWEGKIIKADVEDKGGVFPEEYFSRVGYNGNLGGFLWGDKTGWIQLSACSTLDTQNTCEAKSYCQWSNNYCEANSSQLFPDAEIQNAQDWGVYIDFCSLKKTQDLCESKLTNPFCNWDLNTSSCLFDQENNPKGQPLRGYAWSQRLGWIKFGLQSGDSGFDGVFTNWTLDDPTPPEIPSLPENVWIANKSPLGTIGWTDFAEEPNSKINLVTSDIDYALDPDPMYAGCNSQGGNDSATITQNNKMINVYFPTIGLVDETVAAHHCKYSLSGVIYNTSNKGYFFGIDAQKRAKLEGIDPDNPFPNVIDPSPINLFTLAGELNEKNSTLTTSGLGVADGSNILESHFSPRDIGNNPLVNIPFNLEGKPTTPDQAVRNVYLGYEFDASNYLFDTVEPENNTLYNYPVPISIGKEEVLYPSPGFLNYPQNGPDNHYDYFGGYYVLPLKGLAPTLGGNKFNLKNIKFQFNTKEGLSELPSVSDSMPAVNLISEWSLDENSNLNLPFSYNFTPALEVISGNLNEDLITLDQPLEATFEIKNNGSNAMSRYGIDHIMNFKFANQNEEKSLEVRDINLIPETDPDFGRTDRKASFTRYELWQDNTGLSDLSINEFHTTQEQFHEPKYTFADDPNGVDKNGIYEAEGSIYAEPNDKGPFSPMLIDRGDSPGLELAPLSQDKYSFTLTPSQFIGQIPDPQIEFNLEQYVAYKADSALPQFAIYKAAPFIDQIKVKTIGIGTQGVVTGGQVFEPMISRDLNNVTLTSSADLRKEMRKNVAQITRNMNLEKCDAQANSPLKELPTDPSANCVIVNAANKTIVAVYKGGTLTLGDQKPIQVPAGYKYTLILLDGANLYLKENIVYSDSNSSFGMIVLQNLQNPDEKGGNVFIDPLPTNIVGLLYAEGSILASDDGTTEHLYYGPKSPALTTLTNQLYWQGSIASRNTIGGAPGNIRPAGVDCDFWENTESCSKAYDLDFLRRFAVSYDKEKDVYYSSKSLFSGAGSCKQNPPECSSGSLPSTINLSGPNSTINPKLSKSLDTFFIERDNRPAPLGFTTNSGFTSSQEIR